MSNQVDKYVASMEFDNSHFEKNVATSMSTLEKLKQKLNLNGATRGLEDINAAAGKVNMSGLGGAVDSIKAKFSAMDVVAVTALANITNSAVNAGKRMVSALTIDPIKTGFSEYETKINAIQTIMSNTASKGTTMADVTAVLNELNEYADMTIYNFAEMTKNIGTFTAAGIGLEDSAAAIQGISNLAAASGSTSQQAATAMYQLSQALSSGTVRLMDWNSVVNAGMGGEKFQEALKQTAREHGVAVDSIIEKNGSFRESLREGWLSADVLNDTLKKFTVDGAKEYAQAMIESGKYTQEQADALIKEAEAMNDAATKVKTFTQLWSTLQESAQSGWAQTWELIIGNFEEAREFLTSVSDALGGFINRMSEARNKVLASALGRGVSEISESLKTFMKPAAKAVDAVKEVTKSLADYQKVVDEIWLGKWGRGDNRMAALTEAGWNSDAIQDLVNKSADAEGRWTGYRLTIEDVEKSHKKFGVAIEETTAAQEEQEESLTSLTLAEAIRIERLTKMSDAQLKSIGYSDKQIEALREIERISNKLGIPVKTLLTNLNEINGRWLLLESVKNVGRGVARVFEAMGKAWKDIFPSTTEEKAETLFNFIAGLHKLSTNLLVSDKAAGKFRRTFKGVFALLDLVTTLLGGGLKIAFKAISEVLSAFDMDILDVTANIGDALVAFRDWVFEGNVLAESFDWLVSKLPGLVDSFEAWFDVFKETPAVQKLVDAIESISDAFNKLTSGEIDINQFASELGRSLANLLLSLPDIAIQVGKDFIAGFSNGLGDGIHGVIEDIVDFCTNFVKSFAETLGVQSPSWKAYEIVCDFFQGGINAIKEMLQPALDALKPVSDGIIKVFTNLWDFITDESGNIKWGEIIAGGTVVAMFITLKKFVDAFGILADGIEGINDIIKSADKVVNNFAKVLNGVAWDLKAQALQKMAIAIAILVGCIWVLAQVDDPAALWNAVGVIGALAVIVIGLAWAMGQMSKASIEFDAASKTFKGDNIQKSILQIGLTILALAYAVKLIGDLDPDTAREGFIGLAGIAAGLIVFMGIMGGISRYSGDAAGVGKMMLSIAIAMAIMAIVMKKVAGMDPADIIVGIAVMEAFVLLVIEMGIANRIAGIYGDSFGGNVLKISIAMGIMALVIKMIASMDPADIASGIAALQAFVILIGEMAIINRLAGVNGSKFGGTIMSMATSMMLMAGVMWILSKMDESDVDNGVAIMQKFVLLIGEMILVSKLAGKESAKIAGNIMAMSVAIGVLAGVAWLLGYIPIENLGQGIIAVGLLGLIMAAMIKATRGTQDVSKNLIVMVVAIGIMAAAVVALSFIKDDLAGPVAALGSLMLIFGLMAKLSSEVKVDIKSMGIMLGVIIALAAIIAIFCQIPNIDQALTVAASLSLLLLALGTSLALLNASSSLATSAMTGVGTMMLVLVGLAAIIAILCQIPNMDKALSIALSLSVLILAFSTACLILAAGAAVMAIASAGIGVMIGVIIAMGVLMAAIAGLVAWQPDLEAFLSQALPILKLVGQGIGEFLGGIIAGIGSAILGLLPELGTALSNFMTNIQPFIALAGNVDASVLAGAGYLTAAILALAVANFITGVLEILSLGHSFSDLGAELLVFGIGAMAFLKTIEGVDSSAIDAASNLASMILALTASEAISSIFEKFGGSIDFSGMGENLKAFGEAVIDFSDLISGKIDTTAIEAATNAGELLVALTNSLPKSGGLVQDIFGEHDFSAFATACGEFATCMITINEALSQEGFEIQSDKFEDLAAAGAAFSDLQNSLPKSGGKLQEFLGESDLTAFSTAVRNFVACMLTINVALSQEGFEIQSDKLDQLAAAGTAFSELQNSLPKSGGMVQDFLGVSDLSTFGTAVENFVDCMVRVNDAFGEDFTVNLDAMEDLKQAGLKMEELQSALPKSGGWWQDVAGSSDLSDFGESIKTFAGAILDFSTTSTGLDTTAISNALWYAQKIETFIVGLNDLDYDGVEDFTKDNGPCYDIAQGMAAFSATVADINPVVMPMAIQAAQDLQALIVSLAGIDTSGVAAFKPNAIGVAIKGYSDAVAGIDTTLLATSITVAKELKFFIAGLAGLDTSGIELFTPGPIGDGLKTYSDKIVGIDTEKISASIELAFRLKNFITGLAGMDASGLENFNIESLATSLTAYNSHISTYDADKVTTSIISATNLRTFIVGLAGMDTSGVADFASAIEELSAIDTASFTETFANVNADMFSALAEGLANGLSSVELSVDSMLTNVISKITAVVPSAANEGKNLVIKFASGITASKNHSTSAVATITSAAKNTIRQQYSGFYNAGVYVAKGFANGMKNTTWYVKLEAKALAQAAIDKAEEVLDVNSPSKEFMGIGAYAAEGFAIGLGMYNNRVEDTAARMASVAIGTTRNAMTAILEAVNSDMDAQPTIRPVVDLSNVQTGVNAIRSMMGDTQHIGVQSDLGIVSARMNAMGQNGKNDDVIRAITKLYDKLDSVGNTYNSINGITYDDGSNVSDAIETLVHYAKMGGRV